VRKGAVPVPYIIALILGIIVVGLLAYWFFILGGKIPGITTEQQCASLKQQYCSQWQNTDFEILPGEDGCTTESDCWDQFAPECRGAGIYQPSELECRELLGLRKARGASCTEDLECLSNSCDIPAGATVGTCD